MDSGLQLMWIQTGMQDWLVGMEAHGRMYLLRHSDMYQIFL